MVTMRTPIAPGKRLRITPEALEAYKRARRLYDAATVDQWGRLPEQCRDACRELHELLGCARDIMDTIGLEKMPTEIPYDCWWARDEWDEAVAIRRELERLAAG